MAACVPTASCIEDIMTITPQDVHNKIKEITAPGQFFELADHARDGQTLSIYKHAPATLTDVLQSARNHGDADFMVYEGQRFTFSQYFAQVDRMATALQRDYGVQKGDRVAIAMRNCPEWAIAFTAGILIGAIVVPINSWGKMEELRYSITDCGAKVAICDHARYALIESVLPEMNVSVIVSATGPDFQGSERVQRFEDVLVRAPEAQYEVVAAQAEDPCLILYTSGSTGFPKGVLHRHIAVTQSLMNMFYLGFLLQQLEGPRPFKGGAEREAPLLTVPLFHATGLLNFILPLQLGQKLVMMYKWDTLKALQLIQDEKITGLSTVPAILKELLAHPEFDRYNTSSLIRVAGAGAATPTGLPELMEAKLDRPSRSAGYGMTETMAVTATMSGAIFDLSPNSAGVVSPIMQIRFVDADGTVLPQGQQGEIQLKGITCTPGYWEKPDANRQTFTEDGWMRTGDVGLIDSDGFLHITGRIKEIVIRGGENIYPGEIEGVAYRHDAIREVVVFGVDDPTMGEELAMVCFCHPGASLEVTQLREHLGQHLAGYKVPKYIAFSAEPLPRNASEKLHKLNVKERFLNGLYPL